MENDNANNDELPTGASVFGDGELPTGASVFGDAAEPGSASVFADVEHAAVDVVPAEAIDTPAASVFGDVPASGVDESPVVGEWSPNGDLDLTDGSADISMGEPEPLSVPEPLAAPEPLSVPEPLSTPAHAAEPDTTEVLAMDEGDVPLVDDGADDPVALPDKVISDSDIDRVVIDDEFSTGEPIALDVEPSDAEDIGPWSDLGGSDQGGSEASGSELAAAAPAWGEAEERLDDEAESWDPGPVENDEPAVVIIGGDQSERFFEYDGQPGEGSVQAPVDVAAGGSELQMRILTGLGLLAVAIIAIFLGPIAALVLIVLVVALSAGEFYNALRVGGYQPATLLGLAASVAMPLAVYFRGTQAVALVMALAVIFGLIWYVAGVGGELAVMNLGVTLLGVVYIGVLGSFGAALLETADRVGLNSADDGTGLLLAAVILTMAYDVGAFFSGRSMGKTKLTSISPNKTVEGLFGGAVMTVIASVVFFEIIKFIEPFQSFGSLTDALVLGVAAAIIAPLGDLGESMLKRDLGIKDMGSVLPGHGGFLDRFDALLFVLPTVYFFALAFFYGA